MKTAKVTMLLAAAVLCFGISAIAADRIVIGEMYTNTS